MILLYCGMQYPHYKFHLAVSGPGLCFLSTMVQDVEGAEGVRVQGDAGERELAADKGRG